MYRENIIRLVLTSCAMIVSFLSSTTSSNISVGCVVMLRVFVSSTHFASCFVSQAISITQFLSDHVAELNGRLLKVPDSGRVLRFTHDLVYNDIPWLSGSCLGRL